MEVLQCPKCGSSEVKQVGYPQYQCAHCGTSFIPTQAPTGFVDVVLVKGPAGKTQIDAILALRQATTLSLNEAKRAVENLPAIIARDITVAEGERIKVALEKAGATVMLKPA